MKLADVVFNTKLFILKKYLKEIQWILRLTGALKKV